MLELKATSQQQRVLASESNPQREGEGSHTNRSAAANDVSQNSAESSESYRHILQHVKGTLIMYLKKTPVVDLGNEMLLKIIFSMMHFTERDIADLKEAREELPVYLVDSSKTKKMKREREMSAKKNSSSALSNSNQSYEKTSVKSRGSYNTEGNVYYSQA